MKGMTTKVLRQIPNAISAARLAASPVLLAMAVCRNERFFKYLLLAMLVSDILDGLIARAFNICSKTGAFLDSIADFFAFGISAFAITRLRYDFVANHHVPILFVVGLYVFEVTLAIWRYGKISSFHTVLCRINACIQGFFVMTLFFWNYQISVFYLMIAVSSLAYTEELVLLYLLPEWENDVGGIYWVLKR